MKVKCHKCHNTFDYDPPIIEQPKNFSFLASFYGYKTEPPKIPMPKFFVTHCPYCNAEIQIPVKRP